MDIRQRHLLPIGQFVPGHVADFLLRSLHMRLDLLVQLGIDLTLGQT